MSLQTSIDEELRVFVKTEDDLNQETISNFSDNNISTVKGSITMLFANVINSSIAKVYKFISTLHKNYFLSTASGEYLDDLAKKYSIARYTENNETDESLRYRITIHNLYNSMCNFTGIKQRIIDRYPEVEDVKLHEYNKGTGSCEFILYLTSTADNFDIIKKEILSYSPPGVNINVTTPENISYKLNIVVECSDILSDSEQIDIRKTIKSNLVNIFTESNNREVEYHELITAIKSASSYIKTAKIIKATIDGTNVKTTIIEPNNRYRNVLASDTEIVFV